jgi:hypothetical protein
MNEIKNSTQLTLNFEPGMADRFENVRVFVQDRVRHSTKNQMLIAAEMDVSPSDLTRKLAENENDHRAFKTSDLEKYIETQGDIKPILFLIEKYIVPNQDDAIREQIAELQARLSAKAQLER